MPSPHTTPRCSRSCPPASGRLRPACRAAQDAPAARPRRKTSSYPETASRRTRCRLPSTRGLPDYTKCLLWLSRAGLLVCEGGRGIISEMPLSFRDSIASGIVPVDWPMILVGWQSFGRRKLSTEQVMALASEQIGKGTSEQDELAALLVNTDSRQWQTIDRYLEQLAETQQFDRRVALRKWRLAELKYLLRSFPRLDRRYEYPEDEPLSVFYDLCDFWYAYDELPDSAAMRPQSAGPVEEVLAEQRAWAEQEEALLKDGRRE